MHHPVSSFVDQENIADEKRKRKLLSLEQGWNTPPNKHGTRNNNEKNISRPHTAPQNVQQQYGGGLPELSPRQGNNFNNYNHGSSEGGSPLPRHNTRQTPPPLYPIDSATRRGMPSFDDGVSRSLSYWDNSRKHYIQGLTGDTAIAGKKRFWGSSEKPKKKKNSYDNGDRKKHPLRNNNKSKSKGAFNNEQRPSTSNASLNGAATDRWYLHNKFAQHYLQLGTSPKSRSTNPDNDGGANGGANGGSGNGGSGNGSDMRIGNEVKLVRPMSSASAPGLGRKRNGKGGKGGKRSDEIRTESSGMLSGWDDQ